MVRAKFYVQSVERVSSWYGQPDSQTGSPVESERVKLQAAGGDANKNWSRWTPCGSLEIQINKPEAFGKLEAGKHYFLDLTPAPAAEKDEK